MFQAEKELAEVLVGEKILAVLKLKKSSSAVLKEQTIVRERLIEREGGERRHTTAHSHVAMARNLNCANLSYDQMKPRQSH